jgi:hypothetical protein
MGSPHFIPLLKQQFGLKCGLFVFQYLSSLTEVVNAAYHRTRRGHSRCSFLSTDVSSGTRKKERPPTIADLFDRERFAAAVSRTSSGDLARAEHLRRLKRMAVDRPEEPSSQALPKLGRALTPAEVEFLGLLAEWSVHELFEQQKDDNNKEAA